MSSKFAPESLLALRQVVDEKLTTVDVEHILESLQISDKENLPKDSEEILKQITEKGIIDDLILKLRGKSQPSDYPIHVRGRASVTDSSSSNNLNSSKRYLSVRIHNGAAFVDQLADFEEGSFNRTTIQLLIQFKSERFKTSAVPMSVEPEFNSEFFFVLNNKLGNIEELLSFQEPLKIIALKCDKNGNQTVLSLKNVEWRECLNCMRRDVQIELNGLKNERSITIGTLRVSMEILPKFVRRGIDAEVLNTQFNLEKSRNAEKDKLFMLYAKQWWAEYLKIRPEHKSRLVKLYSNDENGQTFPVFTFVWPINPTKILDSPRLAHRLVSSFELELIADRGIAGQVDIWTSASAILAAKKGDAVGLNVLLCSFLLGFGLNAYVAVGIKQTKPWAWVVTIDDEIIFWDAASGERFKHIQVDYDLPISKQSGAKPKHTFKTIDCIFNHCEFYGNIQMDNRVPVTNFNIKNAKMWKTIDQKAIGALHYSRPFPHSHRNVKIQQSNIETIALSDKIEAELAELIAEFRESLELSTQWDFTMSNILGMAINSYEINDIYDVSPENSEFQQAVRRTIPTGHTFKAFPLRLHSTNPKSILDALARRPVAESILRTRGDNVRFGLCVKTFTYAENSITVWLIIACRFSVQL